MQMHRFDAMVLIMGLLMGVLFLPLAAPAAQATKTVSLTAKEFSFTPASVTLKVGQRVALKLTNEGTVNHEFLSTILNAAKDVEIKVDDVRVAAGKVEEVEFAPRRTVIVEFTPLKAGKFAFWCAEQTNGKLHRDLGMKGTLTVGR